MSVPSVIRRSFAIANDLKVGGTTLDTLVKPETEGGYGAGSTAAAAGSIPLNDGTGVNAVEYWPVTGGNIDPGLARIDRKAEVRSQRAVFPMLSFRSTPVATIPFPAYRRIIEKLFAKTLGGKDNTTAPDPVPGSSAAGFTHTWEPLKFGGTVLRLPPFHLGIIQDDLNRRMSGSIANKVSLNFPLDAEGTGELEAHGLFYGDTQLPAITPTFSSELEYVLMLRDVQAVFDSGPGALTAPTAPTQTPNTTGGILAAGKYIYSVAAYNSNGTTKATVAAAETTTTTATSSVTIKWAAVTGASGYRIYGRKAGTQYLIADVGNPQGLEFTDTGAISDADIAGGLAPTEDTSAGLIPDIQAFEFGFTNNADTKHYAGRNVGLLESGDASLNLRRTSRLWFPQEFKLGGEQDITFAITFGNTNTAQEFNREYSTLQRLVVTLIGAAIPGTSPTAYEQVKVTLYAAQAGTAGGPDALAARGDTTFRVEGNGFYSVADGKDISVSVLNGNEHPIG